MSPALILDLLLALQPMVTSDSDCPSTRDIEKNLFVLLPGNMAQPGTAIVVNETDHLTIRFRPEGAWQDEERSIAVMSRCEDRAKAAAVAIATWWQMRPGPKSGTPESVAATLATERPRRDVHSVRLAAGGFASFIVGGVAPGMRIEAEFAPWATAFAVRLGLAGTGAHEANLVSGQVQFRRLASEVGVTWSRGPLRLDGAGVVSGLFVEGQGYTSDHQSSGLSLGVSAGARLNWILGHMRLWMEIRGVGWPQSQRIVVVNSATDSRSAHELPHGELQSGAGVSVSLDRSRD